MKKNLLRWLQLLIVALIFMGTAFGETQFDSLCSATNVVQSDVIAWLEIPSADFCQPIMYSKTDDAFYSAHDASGAESDLGALFVQSAYNASDFGEKVTIIYGSSQTDGAPFRDLQETYSGRFYECQRILLHLPNQTKEYAVFAAIPYSSIHILYYYDFFVERRFDAFFDGVYETRRMGMQLDEEYHPCFDDRVLILSTGLRGDKMQRYLVMAKLISE